MRNPVPLGTWPTPLEPAPRLAAAVGLRPGDLWVKRDDLTGLGGGGNKVRKLEHLCARALDQGATALVTTGAPQSNHARLTAAAATRLGLSCTLVLQGEPAAARGNLLLDDILGADVVWAGAVGEDALADAAAHAADRIRAEGGVPSIVPFGGSDAVGARGYVTAGRELDAQLPGFAQVVVAVGSGGTMAGLVATLGGARVLGVDTGATGDAAASVRALVEHLRQDEPSSSRERDDAAEPLRLRGDQIGGGYGTVTAEARRAQAVAARTEGIVVDPIYTARALAGLTAAVAEGEIRPGEPTVLLHGGGLPSVFAHDAAELTGDG